MDESVELLRRIQEDAISTETSVGELLRRCQLLASRLSIPGLGDWVRHELNGYPMDVELPSYRILGGVARGHLFGPFGSGIKNAVLPAGNLPEKYRDWGRKAFLRQSIASLEEVAKNPDGPSPQIHWPGDLIAQVQDKFYENMVLGQAWLSLSQSQFVEAVESVRNRTLSFALEAEEYVGTEGIKSEEATDRLSQVFQTNIYGSVTNLAQGSTDFVQIGPVAAGDLDALLQALRSHGLQEEQINALENAIEADAESSEQGIGSRVRKWMGETIGAAISGSQKIAVQTATTVIPKLIQRYYGLE